VSLTADRDYQAGERILAWCGPQPNSRVRCESCMAAFWHILFTHIIDAPLVCMGSHGPSVLHTVPQQLLMDVTNRRPAVAGELWHCGGRKPVRQAAAHSHHPTQRPAVPGAFAVTRQQWHAVQCSAVHAAGCPHSIYTAAGDSSCVHYVCATWLQAKRAALQPAGLATQQTFNITAAQVHNFMVGSPLLCCGVRVMASASTGSQPFALPFTTGPARQPAPLPPAGACRVGDGGVMLLTGRA
jgi:hypothetical protein